MKILLIALAALMSWNLLPAQLGEGLGAEPMRQELENANEDDEKIYEEADTTEGTRYDEKPTEKVDGDSIDSVTDGQYEELENDSAFSEEGYESSTWVYVILVIIGLLAIFAFYRYKIGKGK